MAKFLALGPSDITLNALMHDNACEHKRRSPDYGPCWCRWRKLHSTRARLRITAYPAGDHRITHPPIPDAEG